MNLSVIQKNLEIDRIELKYTFDLKTAERIQTKANEIFQTANHPSLEKVKWEACELKESANAKIQLLANRLKLYGSTQLPQIPALQSTAHQQHVVACCMRIKSDELVLEDLDNRFRGPLQASLDKKTALLEQIASWMEGEHLVEKPYQHWSDNQKIKLLVHLEQVLHNPFEPRFKSSELIRWVKLQERHTYSLPLRRLTTLLEALEGEDTRTSSRKDFWDNLPELERKAHRLADAPDKRKWLQECKLSGLKAYMALHPKEEEESHLIVGGGPAGLIRAIFLSLKGKRFQLIEKRLADKTPRLNTVTLGKWEPKELEILSFLGIIARLEGQISFGHNRPYYIEVALGHLEKAFEQTWQSLRPQEILYGTEISSIEKDGCVTFNSGKTRSFSNVIITDGANGKTKELLGISRINLAKPTLVAYSIFKHSPSSKASLKYRVVHIVKGSWIILKILLYALIFWKNLETAYANTMMDGPSGLSRVASHDYLLRIFRKKEQNVLDKYLDQIRLLNLKMKYQYNNSLESQKAKIEKQLSLRLEKKAQALHGILDFLHSLFNPRGHRMRSAPMQHEKTFLVNVMISKAERALVQVGKSRFYLRGDACHTTDPFSGTGCKTAIEELLADQFFFSLPNPSQEELAILNWGQDHYQQKMIDKAFEERFDYYPETENTERYADFALKDGLIDQEEHQMFLQASAKREAKIELTENELWHLQKIIFKLKERLQRVPSWKNRDLGLTNKEKRLLDQALKGPSKNIKPLLAKLCCLGCPEGWLLGMLSLTDPLAAKP